eukprot:GILJ01000319.1.p1 GENE.GILJ01000319.1~~GILJ01000319.1.p1  ORF type:complete len:210 (+),score=47.90 GILJ01000319.1:80-709(+)
MKAVVVFVCFVALSSAVLAFRDPVNPSCTGSCKNNCYNEDEANGECFCDQHCAYYGDCCADMEKFCSDIQQIPPSIPASQSQDGPSRDHESPEEESPATGPATGPAEGTNAAAAHEANMATFSPDDVTEFAVTAESDFGDVDMMSAQPGDIVVTNNELPPAAEEAPEDGMAPSIPIQMNAQMPVTEVTADNEYVADDGSTAQASFLQFA